MIFCDMDGTLLNSHHQLPAATRDRVRGLVQGGFPFVLASSRMPDAMLPVWQQLGGAAPFISYGGGLIYDWGKVPLKSYGLPWAQAVEIWDYVGKTWPQVCCCAFSDSHWLAKDTENPWISREVEIVGIPAQPLDGLREPCEQMHKLLCMGEPGPIAAAARQLHAVYPGLTIFRSKDTYLEIMSGQASKANAMGTLCEKYGIPIEETVAFGDHLNDLDMLRAAGMGVAMGNALPQVKAQAAVVTLSNDQQGVLHMLDQLEFG